MIIQGAWNLSLGFFKGKEVVVEPTEACFTSDAGLLPIRGSSGDTIGQFRAVPGTPYTIIFVRLSSGRVFGVGGRGLASSLSVSGNRRRPALGRFFRVRGTP